MSGVIGGKRISVGCAGRIGTCGFVLSLAFAPAIEAADRGEDVYKAKCSACHDSGAGHAPRMAVPGEWNERFAAGRAALHAAALAGVPNTAMAAKGGYAELSESDVRAAVDYMLAAAGFVEPARASAVERPAAPPSAAGEPRADDVILTARVAAALRAALARPDSAIEAQDAELVVRGAGIRVRALDGIVRLMGVVADAAIMKRAQSIATGVAGVRGVDMKLVTGGMLDFD